MAGRKLSLNQSDKLIKRALSRSSGPLSTYDIAKKTEISWSTAITHCYKLKAFGVIDGRDEDIKTGSKRTVWWIKRKK